MLSSGPWRGQQTKQQEVRVSIRKILSILSVLTVAIIYFACYSGADAIAPASAPEVGYPVQNNPPDASSAIIPFVGDVHRDEVRLPELEVFVSLKGQPVAGAMIWMEDLATDSAGRPSTSSSRSRVLHSSDSVGKSDASGVCRAVMKSGRARVIASSPEHGCGYAVADRQDGRSRVELRLPSGGLLLLLTDRHGAPVTGLRASVSRTLHSAADLAVEATVDEAPTSNGDVTLPSDEATGVHQATSDARGGLAFHGLAAGKYALQITSPSWLPIHELPPYYDVKDDVVIADVVLGRVFVSLTAFSGDGIVAVKHGTPPNAIPASYELVGRLERSLRRKYACEAIVRLLDGQSDEVSADAVVVSRRKGAIDFKELFRPLGASELRRIDLEGYPNKHDWPLVTVRALSDDLDVSGLPWFGGGAGLKASGLTGVSGISGTALPMPPGEYYLQSSDPVFHEALKKARHEVSEGADSQIVVGLLQSYRLCKFTVVMSDGRNPEYCGLVLQGEADWQRFITSDWTESILALVPVGRCRVSARVLGTEVVEQQVDVLKDVAKQQFVIHVK